MAAFEVLRMKAKPRAREGEEFETPFHGPTLEAFSKEFPEKKDALDAALTEFDAQSIKNFDVYHSKKFEGVAFSFTKLKITPDVIKRLSAKRGSPQEIGSGEISDGDLIVGNDREEASGTEVHTGAKQQDFFLFTGFAPPPDGHAFTAEDVGIDRFLRLLPRVANSLRLGQEPPEVTIYLLGSPTGFGGSVTGGKGEWIDQVKDGGFEKYGELYAEFIKEHEAGENTDRHIVLQGVSKGAVVVEKTLKFLPELRDSIQCLLDTPAGDHTPGGPKAWLKGAQIAAGFTAETIARVMLDDMMQGLMVRGPKFIQDLSRKTGIAVDAPEQLALKRKAALAEILTMMKGTRMDTENNRLFIRRALYDPATSSPMQLVKALGKEPKIAAPIFQRGKSLEVPFAHSHYFLYRRYHRWASILDFVTNSKPTGS